MREFDLRHGDCLEVLRGMDAESVDAVVTDPPYGLSFMGKQWDYDVPSAEVWAECLRVLKPGGHLLAFAGTRTQHRMAVRIEDAGFEIRDLIMWVYGSGFPKSLDVSKAIDKAAGAERTEVIGRSPYEGRRPNAWGGNKNGNNAYGDYAAQPEMPITAPATDAARQWSGWGTALKPALEPITVARKPLDGTVAENVLAHGTGAINVDGCRVAHASEADLATSLSKNPGRDDAVTSGVYGANRPQQQVNTQGRWPANLIHDGSDEVVGLFPVTTSGSGKRRPTAWQSTNAYGFSRSENGASDYEREGDSGSAARFFYCAKASKADRDEVCEGLEAKARGQEYGLDTGGSTPQQTPHKHEPQRNHHPTVKPTALMRYLCRLVTPPGGLVLDPFMGSGSTGKACVLEGFRFIGIEREAEYIEIARARIAAVKVEPSQGDLFTGDSGADPK